MDKKESKSKKTIQEAQYGLLNNKVHSHLLGVSLECLGALDINYLVDDIPVHKYIKFDELINNSVRFVIIWAKSLPNGEEVIIMVNCSVVNHKFRLLGDYLNG